VTVRVGPEVWMGAGPAWRGLMLPQRYDEIEQQEQARQPMKKRSTWNSSQEIDNPPLMGRTTFLSSSRRRRETTTLLRPLISFSTQQRRPLWGYPFFVSVRRGLLVVHIVRDFLLLATCPQGTISRRRFPAAAHHTEQD